MRTKTFFRLWRDIVFNSLKTLKRQSLLKISFVFFCSVIFLAGEFFMCRAGFSFVRDFPGVGQIVSDRLMYLFYFAMFIMLIFSNAIISYATLFKAPDTELLFSYPLEPGSIFRHKSLETVFLGSWAFVVLLVPFMVGYGVTYNADRAFYPFTLLCFLPFLLVAGFLGNIITMSLARFIPAERIKAMLFFIAVSVFLAVFISSRRVYIEEASQTMEIFILNKLIPNIRLSHFPLWPSYWAAESIMQGARGGFNRAAFYLLCLMSTALFLMELSAFFASKIYRAAWLGLRAGARQKFYYINKGIIERVRPIFRIFGRDVAGLIIKDIKLFMRDVAQWSQFLIFFGLLGIYFLNIRNFSYNLLEPFWRNVCAFLNLTATLLTLGSLATRFIFPQISLEGSKFWIIGMAPVGFKRLVYQKFWTSAVMSLLITEALVLVSNRMLGIGGLLMYSSLWTVFIMNFALVGLSVGLGAAFPDFKSRNPARIVSGFGGTLNLIMSIGFILLSVFMVVFPFQLRLKGYLATEEALRKWLFSFMVFISVTGILLCVGPLRYGVIRLKKAEY